jgi:hypothetical protein
MLSSCKAKHTHFTNAKVLLAPTHRKLCTMDKIIKHCNKNMGGSSEKVKMELGTQK